MTQKELTSEEFAEDALRTAPPAWKAAVITTVSVFAVASVGLFVLWLMFLVLSALRGH